MSRRLAAIAFIFCCACIAWMILGATLVARTQDSQTSQLAKLTAQWGDAQTQKAPSASARLAIETYDKERKRTAFGYESVAVPILTSRVNVDLDLEQRRDGLLWYNLYGVRFLGRYRIRNTTTSPHLTINFSFPSANGTYSDFTAAVGGRRLADLTSALEQGYFSFNLAPGSTTWIAIGYRSRGMGTWTYRFGDGVTPVSDFSLAMTTDFDAIDFPPGTGLPTSEERLPRGWRLEWRYGTLLTGNDVGMAFPYPLQPGPLAQRITFWAPVALFFYFFVLLVITTLRRIDLHPINYFFLAAAFFAFHLLFAYLVDRIPIEAAFAICSVVTVFLTVSYLRLVVGMRFAAFESGIAQLVYLILFSLALFNEGWSGLTITIGAIVTLFVTMQATGRIRWSDRLSPDGTIS